MTDQIVNQPTTTSQDSLTAEIFKDMGVEYHDDPVSEETDVNALEAVEDDLEIPQDGESDEVDLGDFKSTAELKKAYDELNKKATQANQELADTQGRIDALYKQMGVDTSIAPEVGIASTEYNQKLAYGQEQLRQHFQHLINTEQITLEDANHQLGKAEVLLESQLKQEAQSKYMQANTRIVKELHAEHADILAIKEVQDAANFFADSEIAKGNILDKRAFKMLLEYGKMLYEKGKAEGSKGSGIPQQQQEIKQKLKTQTASPGSGLVNKGRYKSFDKMSQAEFDKLDNATFEKLLRADVARINKR